MSLQEARKLEEIQDRVANKEFRVRLDMKLVSEEILDQLEDLFVQSPGACPVVFEVCAADGSVALLQAQQRIKVTPELVDQLRQLCGDRAVEMAAP